MPEILKTLFLQAKEKYEGSVKWSLLIAIFLAYSHLVFFWPFLRFEREKQSVQADRDRLQHVGEITGEIAGTLKGMLTIRSLFDVTRGEIIGDFDQLNDRMAVLLTQRSASQPTDRLAGDPRESHRIAAAQDQIPWGRDVRRSAASLPPLPPDLKERIEQKVNLSPGSGGVDGLPHKTMDEIRQMLSDYVRDTITNPRLEALRARWGSRVKGYEAEFNRAGQLVDEGKTLLAGRGDLDGLGNSIQAAKVEMEKATFKPPDDLWWLTRDEKRYTFQVFEESATHSIDEAVVGKGGIDEITKRVAGLAKELEKRQSDLGGEVKQLQDRFEGLNRDLTALGQGFNVVRLDLRSAVVFFPALLGAALAAILVWPSYRRHQLVSSFHLLASASPDHAPLERLVCGASGGVSRASALPGLLAAAWVAAASLQLILSNVFGAAEVVVSVVLGIAAVAAAGVNRRKLIRSLAVQGL